MKPTTAVSSALVFLGFFSAALAHSGLAAPKPTRKLVCRVGNNQPRDCPGPCPPMDSFGSPTGINEGNPAETWKRGEQRYLAWQRNNHKGKKSSHGATGFTRFALVPVDQMMSKDAHQRHAFWYTCWGAGETQCPGRDDITCGNDKDGLRYGTTVTVPKNYKDGVYVLGYAWYGGGDYQEKSFFGDYWSCSFVRIEGGPYEANASPVFSPGQGQPDGGCWSAADRPGVCASEPCHGKGIRLMKPHGAGGALAGGGSGPAPQEQGGGAGGQDQGGSGDDGNGNTNGNDISGDTDGGSNGGNNGGNNRNGGGSDQTQGDDSRNNGNTNNNRNDWGKPEGNDSRYRRYSIEAMKRRGGGGGGGGGGGLISGVSLVDVTSGRKIPLRGSHSFKRADFPGGVNIDVAVSGRAQVRFEWNGKSRVEKTAPFALAGNKGSTYNRWTWGLLYGQSFPVKITAFSGGSSQTVVVTLKFD